MKDPITELAEIVASKIPALIEEARDQINSAITATMEDAQDAAEETREGKPAKLTIPIAITWNLDTRTIDVALTATVRRKYKATGELSDPAQPLLPINDHTVTISTPGMDPVTVTGEQLKRLASRPREGGAE